MIELTTLIIFTLLMIVFSYLDVKSRAIPSVLLTATIFLLAVFRFENFQYVILMGLMGMLLWEFSDDKKVAFGMADIKVMIMLGFFIHSILALLIVIGMIAVGQVLWIFVIKKYFKVKEVPLIPLFFIIWYYGVYWRLFF